MKSRKMENNKMRIFIIMICIISVSIIINSYIKIGKNPIKRLGTSNIIPISYNNDTNEKIDIIQGKIANVEAVEGGTKYINYSDTVTFTLDGTDINYESNSLAEDRIVIKVGGEEIAPTLKELNQPTEIENGIRYELTLSGIPGNGELVIEIDADTLTDKAQNTNIKTIKQTDIIVDNDGPIVSVNPETSEVCKNKNITITAQDNLSQLNTQNTYEYYLSTSDTELIGGSWNSYTLETATTIGQDLTGTYYLMIKSITDKVGNSSSQNGEMKEIDGTNVHVFGPYEFDNTPPNLQEIKVMTDEGAYQSGTQITIRAQFDEKVKGTAPTMTVTFGTGTARTTTAGTVSGDLDYIDYTITIASDDVGELTITTYEGTALTDIAGNVATISKLDNTGNKVIADSIGPLGYIYNDYDEQQQRARISVDVADYESDVDYVELPDGTRQTIYDELKDNVKILILENKSWLYDYESIIRQYFNNVTVDDTYTAETIKNADFDIVISQMAVWASSKKDVLSAAFNSGKSVITIGNDSTNTLDIILNTRSISAGMPGKNQKIDNEITPKINFSGTSWLETDSQHVVTQFEEGTQEWYTCEYNGTESPAVGMYERNDCRWFHSQFAELDLTKAMPYLLRKLTRTTTASYYITEPGTYTFKIYDRAGNCTEKTITTGEATITYDYNENILKNGDFSEGTSNWNASNSYISRYSDSALLYKGKNTLRVKTTDGGTWNAITNDTISSRFYTNTLYKMSFMIYRDSSHSDGDFNSSFRAYLPAYQGDTRVDPTTGRYNKTNVKDKVWTKVEQEFTTTGDRWLSLYMPFTGNTVTASNIWLANVRVERILKDNKMYGNQMGELPTITSSPTNLVTGLEPFIAVSETTGTRAKYSIQNGKIAVTATGNDGWVYTQGRVVLTAGRTYVFSCHTDGTWGTSSGTDTVEAFLIQNGSTSNQIYHMNSNNFEFTPTVSGTYWVRFDVNQSGKTHYFSNVVICDKNEKQFIGWYTEPTGGAKIESTSSVPQQDTTYYAHWLDMSAPQAPSTPDLVDSYDTGYSSTDNITKNWQNIQLTGTASANTKVELYKNGTFYKETTSDANGNYSILVDNNQNSATSWTAYCVSDAGVYSEQSGVLSILSDVVTPTVSFGTNGNSSYQKSHSTTVTASDTGGSGLYSLKYAWSTSSTTAPSFSSTFTNGGTVTGSGVTGTYYLWVQITDKAGNTLTTRSQGFLFDNTAPTVTFSPNGNSTYAKSQSIKITATDTGGSGLNTLKYNWSTSSTTAPSFSATFTNGGTVTGSGATGTYYLWVQITDKAGNTLTTRSQGFLFDNTAPTVSNVTGGSTKWVATTYGRTFTATASDAHSGIASYQWYQGSTAPSSSTGSNVSGSGNSLTYKTTGETYLYVRAVDKVGNVSSWYTTQNANNRARIVATGTANYAQRTNLVHLDCIFDQNDNSAWGNANSSNTDIQSAAMYDNTTKKSLQSSDGGYSPIYLNGSTQFVRFQDKGKDVNFTIEAVVRPTRTGHTNNQYIASTYSDNVVGFAFGLTASDSMFLNTRIQTQSGNLISKSANGKNRQTVQATVASTGGAFRNFE